MTEQEKREIIATVLRELAAIESERLCGTADSYWSGIKERMLESRALEILNVDNATR